MNDTSGESSNSNKTQRLATESVKASLVVIDAKTSVFRPKEVQLRRALFSSEKGVHEK